MTRRWVKQVLHHERDKHGAVTPTGKADEPPLTPRERARRWYALQGWPAHRVNETLARDFPPKATRNGRR